MDDRQESRTEKVAIAVTKTEKTAVRAVAALRETDESNLVRSTPIADIVAEYRRLQGATIGGNGDEVPDTPLAALHALAVGIEKPEDES